MNTRSLHVLRWAKGARTAAAVAGSLAVVAAVGLTAACSDSDDDSGKSVSAFCDQLSSWAAKLDGTFQDSERGGDVAKKALDDLVTNTTSLRDAAPSGIRGDVGTMLDGYVAFNKQYAGVGYDRSKMGEPALETDPKFLSASDRVEKYASEKCGD